jgi:hypothetical protein
MELTLTIIGLVVAICVAAYLGGWFGLEVASDLFEALFEIIVAISCGDTE